LAELTTLSAVTDCYPDKCPGGAGPELVIEASASFRWRTTNVMRARDADEADRLGSGENPCKVNPARGSGMK